jgi:hypothetical protein
MKLQEIIIETTDVGIDVTYRDIDDLVIRALEAAN